MSEALHTESRRRFRAAWIAAGGTVEDLRRTGEERYRHPLCAHPIRTNKRRKDVPAKLLSSYNLNSFCFCFCFCFGFRLRNCLAADGLFLAYLFRSGVGRDLLRSLARGATRYNLSKAAFLKLQLRLPGFDEQRAIAAVLSDMDAELAALEARHAKTRQVKEGMMQALLTGRIRLV